MSKIKIRKKDEIRSEIFSNKERIQRLAQKLQVLKELAGEKQ